MGKIKSVFIIGGYKSETKKFLKKEAEKHDFVLALDGGADIALNAGIMPDMSIGDFDGISSGAKAKIGKEKLFKVARQDNTDMEKGLDLCKVLKPQKITVACAAGGRVDFTVGNFISLLNYAKYFDIEVKSVDFSVYPLIKGGTFKVRKGATVSLVPFTVIKNITLSGLKYTLKNETLKPSQMAVSNSALKDKFTVAFDKGKLLLAVYK